MSESELAARIRRAVKKMPITPVPTVDLVPLLLEAADRIASLELALAMTNKHLAEATARPYEPRDHRQMELPEVPDRLVDK